MATPAPPHDPEDDELTPDGFRVMERAYRERVEQRPVGVSRSAAMADLCDELARREDVCPTDRRRFERFGVPHRLEAEAERACELVPVALLDRATSAEDAEAERAVPRSGVWAGERSADLRALTQDETDALIRRELVQRARSDERDAVLRAIGGVVTFPSWPSGMPSLQRGGLDSDPLVRVLARRAWSDRDAGWFELRGVQRGDRVVVLRNPGGRVAQARRGEGSDLTAIDDAGPGEHVLCRPHGAAPGRSELRFTVDDRVREATMARRRHAYALLIEAGVARGLPTWALARDVALASPPTAKLTFAEAEEVVLDAPVAALGAAVDDAAESFGLDDLLTPLWSALIR